MEEQYEYFLSTDIARKRDIRLMILGSLSRGSNLEVFSKRGSLFTELSGIFLREGVRYNDYVDAPEQEFEMFPENPPSVMYIGLRSMYGTDKPMDYYFVPYDEFLKDLQEIKSKILEYSPNAGPSVDKDFERIKILMELSKRPYDPNDYVQGNNNTLENTTPWTLEKPEE